MTIFKTLWFVLLLISSNLYADVFDISAKRSTLSFSGEHAGRTFSGEFTKWQASLSLPSSSSDIGAIRAEFSTGSAKTGNSLYDETLTEDDWFNVNRFPVATFVSTLIEPKDGDFEVSGELTIKGKTSKVSFTLKPTRKGFEGDFAIDRLDFGIGIESDPDAEWVSKQIKLKLVIVR